MRPPPGARMAEVLALYESGELGRLAREHGTQAKVAAALGLSFDAMGNALKRLQREGRLPAWSELANRKASPVDIEKPDKGSAMPERGNRVTAPTPPPRTVADDIAERRERAETSSLKARLREAIEQLEQCRYELSKVAEVAEATNNVGPIRPREHTSGMREATAVALASDWHIEETVEPEKVNGVNEYNLEIARRRCERYFAGLSYLIRYHQDHFSVRDLILWLGGDLITGYLREEDLEANGASPVQAIAILTEWLSDGIRSVLQSTDIELMNVVCNSGNHGRLTKKMQPRTREANSIEWLLYRMLAREFANEPRVAFTLPHGSQTYVDVYETTIRFTHGDETKFGGGVGGIMIPIRKAIAKWQTVRHADLTVMGHYHQEHFLRDLVVNGSLVGYNEYALSIAAPYEDPRQGFFLVDKHRGITFPATIWVADR